MGGFMGLKRELQFSMIMTEIVVTLLFFPVHADMGGRAKCGIAQQQGRRPHQEDRVLCLPQLLLPSPGGCSDFGLNVGLFGVFDGHNGAEASDYVSRQLPLLLEHHYRSRVMLELHRSQAGFFLEISPGGNTFKDYSFVGLYKEQQEEVAAIEGQMPHGTRKHSRSPVSLCLEMLKDALSRALLDIDSALTIEYGKEIWQSGTTAVVVLKVDDHLLVANIGDSKAFVCLLPTSTDIASEDAATTALHGKDTASLILVKELSIDHHPDRLDERRRIEAAGGFVSTWGGIARVNGQLALSRAIGDAAFKKYGVIAEPEFLEWQVQNMEESYLVITSDGIFEKMYPQDVCNLLQQELEKIDEVTTIELDYEALADAIVNMAYDSGSYDNLAVIVHPLRPSGVIEDLKNSKAHVWDDNGSKDMIEEDQNMLVVKEGDCYELVEKVPNVVVLPLQSFVGLVPTGAIDKVLNTITGIEGSMELNVFSGSIGGSPGPIEVFNEQLICLRRPLFSDEEEVCLNPEMFSTYLRLIEGVPMVGRNFTSATVQDNVDGFNTSLFSSYTRVHERYILTKNIGRGGFGEVWFAVSKNCSGIGRSSQRVLHSKRVLDSALSKQLDTESMVCANSSLATALTEAGYDHQQDVFVLKRILVEKGNEVYLSGMREKHFGEMFRNARKLRDWRTSDTHKRNRLQETYDGIDHIARYVESFEGNGGDLWLVFINEGLPLSSMLYAANTINKDKSYGEGHVQLLEPSSWWKWLKTTSDGQRELRNLLYQLLLGVKACHDWNITHRDIKPENMMVRATSTCLAPAEVGNLQEEFPCNLSMRIIDFGSALDAYSVQNLYGVKGPSRNEQTEEYTPPEAFLQRNWLKVYGKHATGYDVWSIGVVMLELVLGTPHVFQIAARTRALLDQHLEGWGSSALNTAYMLRALMEMCILYPGSGGHHRQKVDMVNLNLASWTCTEESLMQLLREHDPLGIGLGDIWAVRLLRELLQWHPEDRMKVEEALKHPYFHPFLQGKEGQKR